jgi:23S rRNA pseudouridine2605 synthase
MASTTPEKDGVGGNTWLKVILGEGRSRQIRRMFAMVGHQVSKLRRVAIGPVRDRALPVGGFRDLTAAEVEALRSIPPAARPPAPPLRRRRGSPPRTGGGR